MTGGPELSDPHVLGPQPGVESGAGRETHLSNTPPAITRDVVGHVPAILVRIDKETS